MATTARTPEAHELWLEERRKGVGSSDTASLFNVGYGCTTRLVYDKRNTPPDFQRTQKERDLLDLGKNMEELVADMFSERTGLKIRRQPARVSKENSILRTNMDRQIVAATREQLVALAPSLFDSLPDDPGPGVLECKTANTFVFKKNKESGLQDDYILQIQQALAVTGYRWGCFAVLERQGGEFLWFPVLPSDQLIQSIHAKATEIWQAVVDTSLPMPAPRTDKPEICRSCSWRKTCLGEQALLKMAGAEKESMADYVPVNGRFTELVADLIAARERREEFEQIEGSIKTAIQEEMTAQSLVQISTPTARISWKENKPSMRWDTKALEAERPELAEKYKRAQKAARPFNIYTL